jgi:hypothetical protein
VAFYHRLSSVYELGIKNLLKNIPDIIVASHRTEFDANILAKDLCQFLRNWVIR